MFDWLSVVTSHCTVVPDFLDANTSIRVHGTQLDLVTALHNSEVGCSLIALFFAPPHKSCKKWYVALHSPRSAAGALRELRKDASFMADVRDKERAKVDAERMGNEKRCGMRQLCLWIGRCITNKWWWFHANVFKVSVVAGLGCKLATDLSVTLLFIKSCQKSWITIIIKNSLFSWVLCVF
jgi:hypothetical protein